MEFIQKSTNKKISLQKNYSLNERLSVSTKTINLVEKLKDSGEFMQKFNQYNESIENALKMVELYEGSFTGREEQLLILRNVMRKPLHPFAMILGEAGMGKTTLVREFAKRVNSGQLESKRRYIVLQLYFSNITALGKKAKKALENLLANIKRLEGIAQEVLKDKDFHFIIYMDEVHLLINSISENSKSGGDTLKQSLTPSREEDVVRVVASTTRSEYDAYIVTDEALRQRFTPIELPNFKKNELIELINKKWRLFSKLEQDLPINLIEKIMEAGERYFSEDREPRRSETILENIVAWTEDKDGLPTIDDLGKMLSDTRQLSSDNKVDVKRLIDRIHGNILGQEYAKYQVTQWAKGHNIQVGRRSNKPLGVFGFFGPTGVGKSEMAKQISKSLHGDNGNIITIKTPEYTMEDGGDNRMRKEIAEYLSHNPKTVVLVDEFEKGVYRKDNPIKNNLLPLFLDITDEGRITYSELDQDGRMIKQTVDSKQAVFIFTSNASHEVFEEREKFGDMNYNKSVENPVARSKRRLLDSQVQTNLINKYNFSPEFLGRMKKVYFESLSEYTAVKIAEKKIKSYFNLQKYDNNITLVAKAPELMKVEEIRGANEDFMATELAVFLGTVKSDMKNSKSGGARQIDNVIKEELEDILGDAVYERPDCHKFEISIVQLLGDGRVEKANTRGLLPQSIDIDQMRLEVIPCID